MILIYVVYFFFFSSRRRHTRLQGDWSSDVCSSDLQGRGAQRGRDILGCRVVADRGRAADGRPRDCGWRADGRPRGVGQGGGLPAGRRQRREGPVSNAPEIRNVFIRRPIFSGGISIVIG